MNMWALWAVERAGRLPRTSTAPLEGCTHRRTRYRELGLCACNPPEEPSMCVELSQPSTTAQRAHMRHHPFFITPFFSQGQSQHSRSVAALVAVFTRCGSHGVLNRPEH